MEHELQLKHLEHDLSIDFKKLSFAREQNNRNYVNIIHFDIELT